MNANLTAALTANVETLRAALKDAGVYNGVARYSAADMRAYAAKVAHVIDAGVLAQGTVVDAWQLAHGEPAPRPLNAETVDAWVVAADAWKAEIARRAAVVVAAQPAPVAEVAAPAIAAQGRVEPGKFTHLVAVTLTAAHVVDITRLWPALAGHPVLVPGNVVCIRRTTGVEPAALFAKSADRRRFDPWAADADVQVVETPAAGMDLMPRQKGASKTALVRQRAQDNAEAHNAKVDAGEK